MTQIRVYDIRTMKPAPLMCDEIARFRGTYRDAVRMAHLQHRITGRRVLVANQGDPHWWHRVSENLFEDLNRRSGVCPRGNVTPDDSELFEK
jgi:hypothetical protein